MFKHRLRFCFDYLSCVKMAVFQSYLQLGKQIKVGWEGDHSHVVLGQNFLVRKGV
jgi:hypothetical protein